MIFDSSRPERIQNSRHVVSSLSRSLRAAAANRRNSNRSSFRTIRERKIGQQTLEIDFLLLIQSLQMDCPERERLWAAYNEALDTFSQRSSELSAAFQTGQFSMQMTSTEGAQKACMDAREAWERHLKEHGCDRTSVAASPAQI